MNSEPKVIEVVGGIIRRGDSYLLGKRPMSKAQGGLWEFIGGKIESGESPYEALARESNRELFDGLWDELLRTQPQFLRYRKPSKPWTQKALYDGCLAL